MSTPPPLPTRSPVKMRQSFPRLLTLLLVLNIITLLVMMFGFLHFGSILATPAAPALDTGIAPAEGESQAEPPATILDTPAAEPPVPTEALATEPSTPEESLVTESSVETDIVSTQIIAIPADGEYKTTVSLAFQSGDQPYNGMIDYSTEPIGIVFAQEKSSGSLEVTNGILNLNIRAGIQPNTGSLIFSSNQMEITRIPIHPVDLPTVNIIAISHLFAEPNQDAIAIYQLPVSQAVVWSPTTNGNFSRVGIEIWVKPEAIVDMLLQGVGNQKYFNCDDNGCNPVPGEAKFLPDANGLQVYKVREITIPDGEVYSLIRIWGWIPITSLPQN